MDARERWHALQTHLSTARAVADAGDHAAALQEVERALEIDPDFLAAHSLKERLVLGDARPAAPPPDAAAAESAPSPPGLSAIEARVLARRAERKLAAATDAIRRGAVEAAIAAIDEARGLNADPAGILRAERALAERRRARPRRVVTGRRAAAAAALVAAACGAWYLDSRASTAAPPSPRPAVTAPAPPASSGPAVVRPSTREEMITLAPTRRPAPSPSARVPDDQPPSPPDTRRSVPAPIAEAAPAGAIGPIAPPVQTPPPPVRTPPAPALDAPAISTAPVSLPTANLVRPPAPRDDESGVRTALQRYRAAYDGLNAASARAVWPAVDERALAHAFDGLASQRLRFDACDVDVRGDAATAACRGTATYVAKVGSGDPQTEPLRWSFTLRRDAGQWTIQKLVVRR